MYGTHTWQGAAVPESAAALRGSEATLNEQLLRDSSGKLRDQILDELAVAAQDIETALDGKPVAARADVLRDLLDAIRLGESIVAQFWQSVHL
jgi:hypothetical protein